jgi:hypothetical protein
VFGIVVLMLIFDAGLPTNNCGITKTPELEHVEVSSSPTSPAQNRCMFSAAGYWPPLKAASIVATLDPKEEKHTPLVDDRYLSANHQSHRDIAA